jgi:hypothetical protein
MEAVVAVVAELLTAVVGVIIGAVVLAVLVAFGICYLFARQVAPIRPLRSMLIVVGLTLVGGPVGLAVGLLVAGALQRRWRRQGVTGQPSAALPVGLGRPWQPLLSQAAAARERFRRVVDQCADGPLAESLRSALVEVDGAVSEARRLAESGARNDRAHRDVLAALGAQRRQHGRSVALDPDLELPLAQATAAQHASAERLAAAARSDLAQLQLVVARLHELTAHALELSTGAPGHVDLEATLSIADRLTALRLATAEVEAVARL